MMTSLFISNFQSTKLEKDTVWIEENVEMKMLSIQQSFFKCFDVSRLFTGISEFLRDLAWLRVCMCAYGESVRKLGRRARVSLARGLPRCRSGRKLTDWLWLSAFSLALLQITFIHQHVQQPDGGPRGDRPAHRLAHPAPLQEQRGVFVRDARGFGRVAVRPLPPAAHQRWYLHGQARGRHRHLQGQLNYLLLCKHTPYFKKTNDRSDALVIPQKYFNLTPNSLRLSSLDLSFLITWHWWNTILFIVHWINSWCVKINSSRIHQKCQCCGSHLRHLSYIIRDVNW